MLSDRRTDAVVKWFPPLPTSTQHCGASLHLPAFPGSLSLLFVPKFWERLKQSLDDYCVGRKGWICLVPSTWLLFTLPLSPWWPSPLPTMGGGECLFKIGEGHLLGMQTVPGSVLIISSLKDQVGGDVQKLCLESCCRSE